MKILLHYLPTCTYVPFLSSNPKILKAFLTFPTLIKPTKCPAREKKWGMKSKFKKKETEEERRESET